jgi:DNA-binding response OmpR family regulator
MFHANNSVLISGMKKYGKKRRSSMSSELINGLAIGMHHLSYNDEQRVVIIDQRVVKFSPMRYQALRLLLAGNVIAEEELLTTVYGENASVDSKDSLAKLIRKIRSQLLPLGITIEQVAQRGYVLLPIPE